MLQSLIYFIFFYDFHHLIQKSITCSLTRKGWSDSSDSDTYGGIEIRRIVQVKQVANV